MSERRSYLCERRSHICVNGVHTKTEHFAKEGPKVTLCSLHKLHKALRSLSIGKGVMLGVRPWGPTTQTSSSKQPHLRQLDCVPVHTIELAEVGFTYVMNAVRTAFTYVMNAVRTAFTRFGPRRGKTVFFQCERRSLICEWRSHM